MTARNYFKFLLVATGYFVYGAHSLAQTWSQKTNLPGETSTNMGFSANGKGYVLVQFSSTLYEYNPVTNSWSAKAPFPGVPRRNAVCFSIGSKGYIGTGAQLNDTRLKDFWEYDVLTNTWTQKADFASTPREVATGFSIGTKGYLGIGYDGNLKSDFWEYNPASNSWTQKTDFGGGPRAVAVGFSIGNKGYLGTGASTLDNTGLKNDFWEYEPVTNAWSQQSSIPGVARVSALGFSIGTKGYVGTGSGDINGGGGPFFKDFREYDPLNNSWTSRPDYPGSGSFNLISFSTDNNGYVGGGEGGAMFSDFWQFNIPAPVVTITCPANRIVTAASGQCNTIVNNIAPAVSNGSSFTYSLTGATTGSGSGDASGLTFNSGVTTVTYTLTSPANVNCSFTVTVNTNVTPSIGIEASATTICPGTLTTFTATAVNGGSTPFYQWKLNGANVGTNINSYSNASLTNGDAITCILASSLPCASPTTTVSNTIHMTVQSLLTFYRDFDGDGFGNFNDNAQACSAPNGYVLNGTDCDDNNESVHPGITEVCNNFDDDCDGLTDEGCNVVIIECENDKVFVCHNDHRICVSPASVPAHLQHGDILGDCITSVSNKNKTEFEQEAVPDIQLKASPNPSASYFTLRIANDRQDQRIILRVLDLQGRSIEERNILAGNDELQIGNHYRPGVYIAQIIQGNTRKIVKLVKL